MEATINHLTSKFSRTLLAIGSSSWKISDVWKGIGRPFRDSSPRLDTVWRFVPGIGKDIPTFLISISYRLDVSDTYLLTHCIKSPYFVNKSIWMKMFFGGFMSQNLDFWHQKSPKIHLLGWLNIYRLGWAEFYWYKKNLFLDKNWTFNIVCDIHCATFMAFNSTDDQKFGAAEYIDIFLLLSYSKSLCYEKISFLHLFSGIVAIARNQIHSFVVPSSSKN